MLSAWVAADASSIRVLEDAKRVAQTSSTVLIRGESGTGKDLLASLLHFLSPRSNQPLVKIDCASLPQELVESELFGHEKGAFTGALQAKCGRLELAANGTLVLDEVAALSMPVQAKLLRVIEDKSFQRLGGVQTISVDARVIALTNVDLENAVARGTFRQDLFYRLNVVPMEIIPLRERRDDIQPLAEHFLAKYASVHRKLRLRFSSEVLDALENYSFPGNVRELRNLVERAVLYAGGQEIALTELPEHVRTSGAVQKKMSLEELERAYIAEILDYTRGKKSRAAQILGISRKTLLEKRKKYGLD